MRFYGIVIRAVGLRGFICPAYLFLPLSLRNLRGCAGQSGCEFSGNKEAQAVINERFQKASKKKDPGEISRLFWFLSVNSQDLDNDSVFQGLCDAAATIPDQFHPAEVTLMFKISMEKLKNPHQALLQTLTEVLVGTHDLSHYKTSMLVEIVQCIGLRRKELFETAREVSQVPTLFPGQNDLVNHLLKELTAEDRLSAMDAQETFSVFRSASILDFGYGETMKKLQDRILERDIRSALSEEQTARVLYARSLSGPADRYFHKLLDIYAEKVVAQNSVDNLLIVLRSLSVSNCPIPNSISKLIPLVDADLLAGLENKSLLRWFVNVKKLKLKGESLMRLLASEAVKEERMTSFSGRDLIAIVHTLSDFNPKNYLDLISAISNKVLTGKLQGTGESFLSSLNIVQLCGIIDSFSKMGLHQEWSLQVLLREILRPGRRDQLDEAGVAIILHSMGKRCIENEDIIGFVRDRWLNTSRLRKFSNQHLAMMIKGLVNIPKGGHTADVHQILKELISERRLKATDDICLVGTVHSLRESALEKNSDLVKLIDEATKTGRVNSMSSRCLSVLVYSVAKMRSLEMSIRRQYCQVLIKEVMNPYRLKLIDNHGLTMIMSGLTMVGGYEMEVRTIAEELFKTRRTCGLEDNGFIQEVHVTAALARIHTEDRGEILRKISSRLSERDISTISSTGLVILVTKFAEMNYKDKEFYIQLMNEAVRKQRIGLLKQSDLPLMAEALGRLGYTEILFDVMWKTMKDVEHPEKYEKADLLRLLRAINSVRNMNLPNYVEKAYNRISNLLNGRGLHVDRAVPNS